MSWDHTYPSHSTYVEQQHIHITAPAALPQTPTQHFSTDWPTPSTESRLNHYTPPSVSQSHTGQRHSKRTGLGVKQAHSPALHPNPHGLGVHLQNLQNPNSAPTFSPVYPTQSPVSHPPSAAAHPTLSSPAIFETPQGPYHTAGSQPLNILQTPPLSAGPLRPDIPRHRSHSHLTMDLSQHHTQRRLSSHGQRPVMGPPETPSRGMIPQSPGLFSNIAFSPDLFSQHQVTEPQTAPVFPQQRLFWDPSTTTPLPNTPQQFHTPSAFPDDFSTSFNSNSTIMPHNFVTTPQNMPYDLPSVSQSMSTSFMDGSVFPAPFQTSPRMPAPYVENPTQFLSSPARRFGGEPKHESTSATAAMPELPAYHHQLQESKREKELLARQRRKSRTIKRSQDDDLVMKSVKRALSPKKNQRPILTRSATVAGVQTNLRRSSSALDSISLSSASSRSTRGGRSSPLRRIRRTVRRSSAAASLSRSSLSLAIDDHGVARTIMNSLPEGFDESIDEDDESTDQMSSEDDNDHHILYSFADDPHGSHDSLMSTGDARHEIRSSAFLTMGSDRVARVSHQQPALDPRLGAYDPQSTIRRVRGETLTSTNTDATQGGNAQYALRALMQDRSTSASSHASSSSIQFHSSPPLPHALLGFNASPTTITDPDLATPSTDTGSHGSADATRCICNSSSPDGNIMIQCDSCTKWLHAKCVGLTNRNIPDIYVCTFCEQTPMRGGTVRATARSAALHQSPLAHKSSAQKPPRRR